MIETAADDDRDRGTMIETAAQTAARRHRPRMIQTTAAMTAAPMIQTAAPMIQQDRNQRNGQWWFIIAHTR